MNTTGTVSLRPMDFSGSAGIALKGDVRTCDAAASGSPVLLLHGGGQTRRAWDRAAQDLARAGFTAITIDQRGHGESAWARDGAYTYEDYGADAVALGQQVRARFGQAPALVGASLGGIAGMMAEAQAGPGFWRALVLVDITPFMDPDGVEKIQSFMGAAMHEGFSSLEEAADAVAAYLPHRKRPPSVDGLRKNLRYDEDGRYRWHWDPRFLDGPRSVNAGRARAEKAMSAGLRATTSPVLLVRGASSELIAAEHVEAFLALSPRASSVDVSGAGHMVAGDRNDIFSDHITAFLKGLPRG